MHDQIKIKSLFRSKIITEVCLVIFVVLHFFMQRTSDLFFRTPFCIIIWITGATKIIKVVNVLFCKVTLFYVFIKHIHFHTTHHCFHYQFKQVAHKKVKVLSYFHGQKPLQITPLNIYFVISKGMHFYLTFKKN